MVEMETIREIQGLVITVEVQVVMDGDAEQPGYIPFGGSSSALPGQGKKVLWLGATITYCGFCTVCDLFNESGVNLYNLSQFTLDNLHLNDAGSERISHNMAERFNSIL